MALKKKTVMNTASSLYNFVGFFKQYGIFLTFAKIISI